MSTLKLVPASGSPIEVDAEKQAMVGRDASADVVVNDSSVSRKHARLERWGSNWAVIDQRSANGTFLDGQRITESVLQEGQELRFGKVAFRVEIAAADFGATVMMSSPVSEATVMEPAAPRPRPAPAPAPVRPAAPPPPRPAAPPPAPAPAPYVPPPEPVREGKGPLFWIATVFALLLFLGLIGVGAVMGPDFLKAKAAMEAARAQIKEMAEGDMDSAYGRTTKKYQAAHPAEAFAAFVDRHPGLRRNTDAAFDNRSVQGDTAKISGTLTHGAGTEKAFYELVKEGGEWKVAGLEVDGDEGRAPATSAPGGAGLTVETVAVNKTRQGQTVTIKIDVRVTGFDLRPEGNLFRVDLAEDLETFGPDGKRIDELSRAGLETYNQTTSSATDATATFNNSLTFTRPDPGRYKAAITIRDRVGVKSKRHEVPFDLP
jgi:FHA domain-containing protein/uncharacterized protein DUF4864